jgi:spore morphogenesis protein SipL
MLMNFIEIIGIATVDQFPVLGPLDRYKQFIVDETLIIPEAKPDVEQITSVMVESNVTGFRTIATPTGLKVIINGELTQKVIYTADEPTQSVHSAHFVKPYCTFIEIPLVIPAGSNVIEILQGLNITLDDVVTAGPNVLVEDLSVTLVDERTIKKCAIQFTWVTVNALLTPFLPVV